MKAETRIRALRRALTVALPLLRADRDVIVECHSLLDKRNLEPIPGTLDADVVDVVGEYDRAIRQGEAALRKR